jgi:hypothetical protein
MNIFTTEHPLDSVPSWFDTKEHPLLSFVCSVLVLALMLAPLVLVRLILYAFSDIGAEPNPFPDPVAALLVGSVLAFALSLVCAIPVVLAYRLLTQTWRRRPTPKSPEPTAVGAVAGRN